MRNASVGCSRSTSAKVAKLAPPRGMSTWLATEYGLPVSRTSASRKSSNRLLMPSAMARTIVARSACGIFPHGPLRAARAAATAASTSALPAVWAWAVTSPVIGYRTSNVLPVSTNLPFMKFGSCRTVISLRTLEPAFSVLFVLLLGRTLGQGLVACRPVCCGHLAEDDPDGFLLGHVGLHDGFGQLADQCPQLLRTASLRQRDFDQRHLFAAPDGDLAEGGEL